MQIKQNEAEARRAEGEGEAAYVEITGRAEATKAQAIGLAEAKAVEALGVARATGFEEQRRAIGEGATAVVARAISAWCGADGRGARASFSSLRCRASCNSS